MNFTLTVLLGFLLQTPARGSEVELNLLTGPSLKAEQFKSFEGNSGGKLGSDQRLNLFVSLGNKVPESDWSYGIATYLEHESLRNAAYAGLDSVGTPQVTTPTSRVANTLWLGPFAQWSYGVFSLTVLYVYYGRRWDTGIQEGSMKTDFWKAWAFYPGLTFALNSEVSLQINLEYRYLYYKTHLLYGNQSIRPLIGFKVNL